MIDYLIMIMILAFLGFDLLFKVKKENGSSHFFDIQNTTALRGFWCFVVILVHIPLAYQNRIQDMIGSFAYIGVTFFFMTSGYGLALKHRKNPESIRLFWRQRLPKILIIGWLVSIISQLLNIFILGEQISFWGMFKVNLWIQWLIVCYFCFWITHRFKYKLKKAILRKVICILLITVFSLTMYVLKYKGIIKVTIWPTECFGFIWGLILVDVKEVFIKRIRIKWIRNTIILMFVAALLGVSYLKFKPVLFFGDYLLKIILGLAIIVFMLASNVKLSYGNAVSLFLGKRSFEIYLSHIYVIHIMKKMFLHMSSGVFILLTLLITVLVASIIHLVATYIMKLVNSIPFIKGKNV